jgi:predicted esterase
MRAHTIPATIHGRYLVDPASSAGLPVLVGFHGYAERAEAMLEAMRRIRGEREWLLVSVQALNRFYTRAQDVVASWMTREDRELAIESNIDYVSSVVAAIGREHATKGPIVYAGFSQGVAMAYRALAFAHTRVAGVPAAAGGIMLAGDIPPDVVPHLAELPPLLIGRGTADGWYTEQKAAADLRQLADSPLTPQVHVFEGGHVWDDSFIMAAAQFLDRTVGEAGSSNRA